MKSYLSDTLQSIKSDALKSSFLKINTSVPQGSILGPFLFTIYINDFPRYILQKFIMYADDITLLFTQFI